MMAELLAIDWGTTNRRVFVLDEGGAVLETLRDDHGVTAIDRTAYAPALAELRARYGDLPVLLAGMVGSTRGWHEVAYLSCPAGVTEVASALHWIEPGRTAIVPGLADPAGDVMRGEEVQLLGAVAAGLAPGDGLLCQPGTHCKWARMAGGQVAGFATAMTGELFALLRRHSLLADFLHGEVRDDAAFHEGVRDGLSGALTMRLFRVRAAALLGRRSVEDSASYTSGLLIGHDVGGAGLAPGETVHVLADPQLGGLYRSAIHIAGGQSVLVESHAAFVAGILQIWKATRS